MRIVVGLGNPGERYDATRHNIGFRVVEALAGALGVSLTDGRYEARFGIGRVGGDDLGLLLPQTYMNRSGDALARLLRDYPSLDVSRDVVIVVDDLDLPFGRLRIRPRGGSGGHRGLDSLIDCLETDEFARIRFGIGRPPGSLDTVEYVLQGFSPAEEEIMPAAIERALEAVRVIFDEGVQPAMSQFNGSWVPEPDTSKGGLEREPEAGSDLN